MNQKLIFFSIFCWFILGNIRAQILKYPSYSIQKNENINRKVDGNTSIQNTSQTDTLQPLIIPFTNGFENASDIEGWVLSKSWLREKSLTCYQGDYEINSYVANEKEKNNWAISRSISLQAGTYRLVFYYKTIIFLGTPLYASFDVGYKTAQDTAQMHIIQKVDSISTFSNWVRNQIDFIISEAGVYNVGINHRPTEDGYEDDFHVDNFSVFKVLGHDLEIVAPVSGYALSTPINHFKNGDFCAQAQNAGLDTIHNIKLSLWENNQNIGISPDSISVLASGKISVPLCVNSNFIPSNMEPYNLKLKMDGLETDENPENNSTNLTHFITDTVFATDNNTITGGIGSNEGSIIFGNMYTFTEKDTLTSVSIGFNTISSDLNFQIAIYKILGDSTATEIMSVPAKRTTDMEYSMQTYTFNPRILDAGKYLVAAIQLTAENLNINLDTNKNGYFYIIENNKYWKYSNAKGNIALRANVGHNATLINQDVAIEAIVQPLKDIATFSSNEKIVIRVKNYGLQTAHAISVHCKVNGQVLPVQSIDSLKTNESKDITFTTDLSGAQKYIICSYTNLANDQNRSNDTIYKTLIGRTSPALTWDFNQGMPTDFSIIRADNGIPKSNLTSVFPNNEAWKTVSEAATGKSPLCAATTSWFTLSTEKANRWMITPYIQLSNSNSMDWDAMTTDASYPESYEVRISTSGRNISDFNTVLFTQTAEKAAWNTHTLNLSNYDNQKVAIAFVYNSQNKYVMLLDNIQIYGNATTGSSDIPTQQSSIQIYPNPAQNFAYINSTEPIHAIKIVNTLGQSILQENGVNYNSYILQTTQMKTGIYFIIIETEKGIYTQKLVIKK